MEGNPAKVSRATTQPTTDQRCMRGPKQDQSIPNQTSRAIWLSHCLLRKHGFFFFKTRTPFFISSFLAFEVLLDDILGPRFFAIVLNHHTTATNHLTRFSLSVSFTEADPFPEFLVVITLDKADLMLITKGLYQLDIRRLITVGHKHTWMGLVLV